MPTVGDLLKSAFRVAFQRPGVFFVIALVAHLPLFAGQWLTRQSPDNVSVGAPGLAEIIGLLLYYVLIPLQTGAMAFGVFQQLRGGQEATLGACVAAVARRLGPLLGASILSGLAIFAGSLACVIPGVVIQAGLFVVIPVIMVEREVSVSGALKRSWHLTDYAKLTLFVFVLVLGLPNMVLGLLPIFYSGMNPFLLLILTFFVQFFFAAVLSVGQGVAYQQLRNFKEGTETDELVAVFE
jgi:hypothetical protein